MSSYLVRVAGCTVGTVTTNGTVVANERLDIDYRLVTFSTGEVRKMRYTQALAVVENN
jgi:hypothetical protein